jgi:GNAT superfamily N-acetyltransferase
MDFDHLHDRIMALRPGGMSLTASSWTGEPGDCEFSLLDGKKSVGHGVVGFSDDGSTCEIVLRQLYLDEAAQGRGVGTDLLHALCEIALDDPQINQLCVPCDDEGSYVWAKMGVPCTDPDTGFVYEVQESLDLLIYERRLDEATAADLRAHVEAALASTDPAAAIIAIEQDHPAVAKELLEDAQWIGHVKLDDIPELMRALAERRRPRLGDVEAAPAEAQVARQSPAARPTL